MAPHLGIYSIMWILFCSCAAMPDIHKQMSKSQLQSIFHVDDTELVPNYEIVKLIHNSDSSNNIHNINKRSINNNNSYNNKNSDSSNSNSNLNSIQNYEKHERHVKKDLSKITYVSDSNNINNNNNNSKINSDNSNVINNNDSKLNDTHNITVNAFGDSINLNLVKTDGLFKNGPASLRMWAVKTDPNSTQGLDYEEIVEEKNTEDHIGEVFQDEHNMAAILMRRHLETGDLLMEGSIGHELVIKPMPIDILPHTADGRVHHVVYKRQVAEEDIEQLSDFAYMEPDRLQKRHRRKRSLEELLLQNVTDASSRNKRAVPHIIYPEILVIVDYDGYRLHGGDNVQVKRYFVSFWNGVDLRYRLLKGPRIRISIAGIIISRGRDATPYLERNRVGRDAIDSAAALTDMGKYLFRERRLPVYDIAVAITKLDMCRRQYANDACNRGTAGFAYVGGACVVNKRLEKVNSVAIIEDTGGFSGIIVAAHEVGHLLGAVHDGSPSPSYLGGPGAEKCRWEDGYIMSDLRHTERGFRWSACTVQSFHHFLNGDTASCLHNAPHEDEALGRTLPGTLLSLDAQCRRDRGTSACFKDERVCAQLFCFDSSSGYCVAYRPAAEGSSCGDGSHCLDGRCVAENENIIPDYSQHTPSYASPNSYNQALNTDKYIYNDDTATKATTTTTTAKTTTNTRTTTTRRTTKLIPTTTPTTTTTQSSYFNTKSTIRSYFNNAFFNSFSKFTSTVEPKSNYNYNYARTTTSSRPTIITTQRPITTTSYVPTTPSKFKFNFFDNFFKTTTRLTTRSTTTEPPSFYYEMNGDQTNNNNNNNNQNINYDGYEYTTIPTIVTTTIPTTTKAPIIYPFTFTNSFNRLSTTTKYPFYTPTLTTRKFTTTTVRPTTLPHLTKPSTTSYNNPTSSTQFTRHPVFDVYFKRSTTKNPYDFSNFNQYFKTSSPRYSSNYFGSNSNNLMVNSTTLTSQR